MANVLTVYGVNADWINAGTIKGVTIISDNPDTPYSTQIKDGSISIYGSKSGVPLRAGRIGSFKKTSETFNLIFNYIANFLRSIHPVITSFTFFRFYLFVYT